MMIFTIPVKVAQRICIIIPAVQNYTRLFTEMESSPRTSYCLYKQVIKKKVKGCMYRDVITEKVYKQGRDGSHTSRF